MSSSSQRRSLGRTAAVVFVGTIVIALLMTAAIVADLPQAVVVAVGVILALPLWNWALRGK